MAIVVIPKEAKTVPCPNCGRVLRNLALLGIKRQVACACGTTITVERRKSEALVEVAERRQRSA